MLMIFDCDGVLVDSEPIAARVLSQYMSDLGHAICDADNHDRFAGLRLDAVRAILENENGELLPEDFEVEIRRRDFIAFETQLQPIPGVVAAISSIYARRCVASSGSEKKIHNSLRLTGLSELLGDNVFSAQDPRVTNGKPAPDLFLLAARDMGVKANECIVIEDSVPGVRAGKSAGMCVFGFYGGGHCSPTHANSLLAAGADKVFNDMVQLPKLTMSKI